LKKITSEEFFTIFKNIADLVNKFKKDEEERKKKEARMAKK